jgi:hypothetical protein
VSVTVSKLVWAYGPKVRGPRMLLLAIAEYANDDGVAWPGQPVLAAAILQTRRTVQRLSDRLAREGWMEVLPRTAPVRMSDGRYEQRGTSYKINLAKLRGELPTRQSERSAAGAASHRSGAVETARRDDKTVAPRRQNANAETTKSTLRDDKIGAPLMNYQEPPRNHQGRTTHPIALSLGAACAKSKSADQEQERRTTASAKAKATTPVMRSAEASMERGGGSGMNSGRVIPFRGRRDPEIIRAGLDGFEAALFDETMRVLGECGMGPKSVTRRMRNAVEDALRARMESEQCSLADAGSYLTERWDLYVECRHSLTNLVEARRFFAEGYWLDDRRWDWSLAAKEHLSRLGAARTGMR